MNTEYGAATYAENDTERLNPSFDGVVGLIQRGV